MQNNFEYYHLIVLILQKVQVDEATININLHMKSEIWASRLGYSSRLSFVTPVAQSD